MKLWKDFGVRALLATASLGGTIAAVIMVIWYEMITTETMALISVLAVLTTSAFSFYFGTKAEK